MHYFVWNFCFYWRYFHFATKILFLSNNAVPKYGSIRDYDNIWWFNDSNKEEILQTTQQKYSRRQQWAWWWLDKWSTLTLFVSMNHIKKCPMSACLDYCFDFSFSFQYLIFWILAFLLILTESILFIIDWLSNGWFYLLIVWNCYYYHIWAMIIFASSCHNQSWHAIEFSSLQMLLFLLLKIS